MEVKATWYRNVYKFEDGEEYDWVENEYRDDEETNKLDDAVVVREYDSVDEAVRDFLNSRVSDDTESIYLNNLKSSIYLGSFNVDNEKQLAEKRIWVESRILKKDENGEFVPLSKKELDDMYDREKVSYYYICDALNVEYANGASANDEAREIYKKYNYRSIYLKKFRKK